MFQGPACSSCSPVAMLCGQNGQALAQPPEVLARAGLQPSMALDARGCQQAELRSSAHHAPLHRYDGQTFVKPPEVLARDRLLGTYEVRPTLDRLRTTLLGAAGGLLLSAVLLLGSFAAEADASTRAPRPVCLA